MLGEKVGEFTGKETSRRVIQGQNNNGPNMEITMQTTGTFYGTQFQDTGTYTATLENGHLNGNGIGISMSKDGDTLTWNVNGAGRFNNNGGISWRGSCYYKTNSQKHARVNGNCFIYEYEVDANGNCQGKIFEWK